MGIPEMALLLSAANFALTWLVAFYMYLANKNKVTNERITTLQRDIDDKLDDHAVRIAKLETRVESAPTHDDLGALHEKINAAAKDIAELKGEIAGIAANVRQMLDLALERGMR